MTTVPRIAYQPIAHPKAEKTVKIDKNLKISINLLFLNTLVSILFTLYGIRPHHHQPTKKAAIEAFSSDSRQCQQFN